MIEVSCPHCGGTVVVEEVNCAIFRHGALVATGEQMPPHAPQSECDALVVAGAIYGCGRPFRVLPDGDGWVAIVCDYI